jgi:hypothetical protein
MAQASKRRPWVVEMQPPGLDGWFAMGAFYDEDEAKAQAKLMLKRIRKDGGTTSIRYRNAFEQNLTEGDYAAFMGT